MPLRTRYRRMLIALAAVTGSLLVIWLSLPLWFPWVLRPLARKAGAHYARYQREGYSHFSLEALAYTNRSIHLTAGRVEALTPTAWLWRLAVGTPQPQHPFLTITGWDFQSLPSSNAAPASIPSAAQKYAGELDLLRRWLPVAALSNGTVKVQNIVAELPALTWVNGSLWTEVSVPKLAQQAVVALHVSNAPPIAVQIQSESLHLQSHILITTNTAGLSLLSTNRWRNNPIQFQAQFGPTGTLPQQATLQAPQFQIPASLVKLPQYQHLTGSLLAKWQRGQFTLDLSTRAHPLPAQTNLPPVDVQLHARGDTNRAVIETATVSAPWLKANLSHELVVHYTVPLLRQPASFTLTADLSTQPWVPLEGTLSGDAEFIPAQGKFPAAHFQLAGSDIGIPKLKARTFQFAGNFNWPWLSITNAHAVFEDGSTASLSAGLEVQKKFLQNGHFAFTGTLARRWLPAGYSYQDLTLSGDLSGPITNLDHSGRLEITNLTSPDLRPLQLALNWKGTQEDLSRLAMTISADHTSLVADGALAVEGTGGRLHFEMLTLRKDGKARLNLEAPAQISFKRLPGSAAAWLAKVNSLHWTGPGGALNLDGIVQWPQWGSLRASVTGVHSDLLEDFLKSKPTPVLLRTCALSAAWTNAPVDFTLELSAEDQDNIPLAAQFNLAGNAKGLSLQELTITSQSTPVITANGFVPLTLTPANPSRLIHINSNAPVSLQAVARPEGVLWQKVAAWTGLRLQSPHLDVTVSGTWNQPEGRLQMQVPQILLARSKRPMPTIENLRLDLQVDRQSARLVQGQLLLQGQPLSFTADLPLGQNFWTGLAAKKLPNLDQASAHLQFNHAELAAFTALYPSLVAPQGELNLDLSLLPGFKFQGQLTLQNARTQPLPSLGPVRKIALDLKLRDRLLVLQTASADVGGSTVQMSGSAQLSTTNFLKHELPPFSFSLSGTNVPLVRESGVIVRADLLLDATSTNGAPPLVSGSVHLRNSYYLSDLSVLMAGKIASPRQHPPYFSINSPLLADWRLAVHVAGDRFLKVRMTVFNGEVSANFDLSGTLKDPLAVGDIRIPSGVVQFPFGSLHVQQGFITITKADPYQIQLSITAHSTQFGYDIQMHVSGTANAPVVEFSSTPPLTSEQILLLLTAGQMPQGSFTLTPQQRAQTLAMFLARDLLARLGLSTTESRLTVTSGEQISVTGRPTYTIEFKLTKKWSLVAEYDRFGDYNAGVKWRIYSK